jgi:hypothetical protein
MAHLGPIDPQVLSKRQGRFFVVERQSPLEAFHAVKYVREYSLTPLDAVMAFLLKRTVAPQIALETATELAARLAQPILEKIEPYDLGAFELDSSLANDYCRRICDPADMSKRTQRGADYRSLVEKYPAHEFTIDIAEASSLGLNVCEPSDRLADLFDELREDIDDIHLYVGLVSGEEQEA